MNTTQRRTHILDYLKQADRPLSATALARRLSVSRQIIVGDVALLRAAGEPISATPRGYVLERPRPGLSRTVACLHSGADMERELTLMVDQGCTVENVIVEHPVYGQITGPLDLSSRYDISEFLRKVEEHAARPLSLLTDGIHLHTLRCPGEDAFRRAVAALDQAGFLAR
ncbi:MAG: transcription repressor NadR [Oscillospiraceae bacterium]|nr:transcription repressor NadR [Oscillospiraceae bacterium]